MTTNKQTQLITLLDKLDAQTTASRAMQKEINETIKTKQQELKALKSKDYTTIINENGTNAQSAVTASIENKKQQLQIEKEIKEMFELNKHLSDELESVAIEHEQEVSDLVVEVINNGHVQTVKNEFKTAFQEFYKQVQQQLKTLLDEKNEQLRNAKEQDKAIYQRANLYVRKPFDWDDE